MWSSVWSSKEPPKNFQSEIHACFFSLHFTLYNLTLFRKTEVEIYVPNPLYESTEEEKEEETNGDEISQVSNTPGAFLDLSKN